MDLGVEPGHPCFSKTAGDPKFYHSCRQWLSIVSYRNQDPKYWASACYMSHVYTALKVGPSAYHRFSIFRIYIPHWERKNSDCSTSQMLQPMISAQVS